MLSRRLLRFVAPVLLAVAAAQSVGCGSLWHNMQEHRRFRLNQGTEMSSGMDVYSAVTEPAPFTPT